MTSALTPMTGLTKRAGLPTCPTTIAYLIEVDYDTLRGAERPFHADVGRARRPARGQGEGSLQTTGTLVVSWPLTAIAGPSIGSVAAHALAHGLCEATTSASVFDTLHDDG